jgi:hypothetical protein
LEVPQIGLVKIPFNELRSIKKCSQMPGLLKPDQEFIQPFKIIPGGAKNRNAYRFPVEIRIIPGNSGAAKIIFFKCFQKRIFISEDVFNVVVIRYSVKKSGLSQ